MRIAGRLISHSNIMPLRRHPALAALLVALFVAAHSAKGSGIEDGFYSTSDDPSAQVVTDQNGRSLRLGQKHSPQILEATIFSQNNANSLFLLRVTIPNKGNKAGSIFSQNIIGTNFDLSVPLTNDDYAAESISILAIGGRTYARNGWGSAASSYQLQFPFSGQDNAKDIANYFEVPVTYRKHPGYNLLVAFTPSKPAFEVGEQVQVTMQIQNVGSNAFAFQDGGRNRAARNCQYTFVATLGDKPVPDVGSNFNFGGLSSDRVLKPGEIFTNTVVLNKWFASDKPGTYQIHGSYYMAFKRLNENNVTLQPWWEPVWEDNATAEFTVKIVPPSQN